MIWENKELIAEYRFGIASKLCFSVACKNDVKFLVIEVKLYNRERKKWKSISKRRLTLPIISSYHTDVEMRLDEFLDLKEKDMLNKDIHPTNLVDIILDGMLKIKQSYEDIPTYKEENMVFRRKRRKIKRDYFYEDGNSADVAKCEGDGGNISKDLNK